MECGRADDEAEDGMEAPDQEEEAEQMKKDKEDHPEQECGEEAEDDGDDVSKFSDKEDDHLPPSPSPDPNRSHPAPKVQVLFFSFCSRKPLIAPAPLRQWRAKMGRATRNCRPRRVGEE